MKVRPKIRKTITKPNKINNNKKKKIKKKTANRRKRQLKEKKISHRQNI